MADQEQLDDFLAALEGLGGSAKSPALQALGWRDDVYQEGRAELVARRIVVRGRGRSDSVAMVGAEAPVAATAPAGARGRAKASGNEAGPIGFEAQLWKAADALRNNMDAAECKHVVLRLLCSPSSTSPTPSMPSTQRWRPSGTRAPTRRTRTSTGPRTSSGCPGRLAGRI